MRRVATLLLALSACDGDGGGTPGTISPSQFCAKFIEAICDKEATCGTDDRATCIAFLTEAYDACPLDVAAVAMHEADYDAAAAAQLLAAIRAGACDSGLPDFVTDFPVFTPKLGAGAVCHSDVSCTVGLICDDVTVAGPQGICTAP